MTTETKPRRGDRVELVSNVFGPTLPATSIGVVAEVYDEDETTQLGTQYFPIAVAFPALRNNMPADAGPVIFEGLDTGNLHKGDVVPMRADELRVTGNIFDEGYEEAK